MFNLFSWAFFFSVPETGGGGESALRPTEIQDHKSYDNETWWVNSTSKNFFFDVRKMGLWGHLTLELRHHCALRPSWSAMLDF